MNSNWSEAQRETAAANADLVAKRFPELAALLGLSNPEGIDALIARVPDDWTLEETPAGVPTLRAGGVYIHSRRDPLREGERIASDQAAAGSEGCVFFTPGLAYACEALAKHGSKNRIFIVEPDIFAFTALLASRPLGSLLSHSQLILVVGLPPDETRSVLERLGGLELPQFTPRAVLPQEREWLSSYREILRRSEQKREINRNTLRRFGPLWLNNMCRNLPEIRDRDGIGRFAGIFPDIPALMLAAGPSLDEILPHLPELSKRCVVIAVDTALRACLHAGVQPDFTVLVDPQYWNWRHLDGTKAPRTVLITESAAWPAVFRYPVKALFLCSSLFPLGKFLEARTDVKGELGAGGSVATTAWDFARHLGCRKIYAAGLDLSFPNRQTHFKGSVFEERVHTASSRLGPSETAGFKALYGAGPYPVSDYRGGTVLTDKRLSLYAWWFEARLAAYPAHETYILTHRGMKIPGIEPADRRAVLGGEDRRELIDRRMEAALARPYTVSAEAFTQAVVELKSALTDFATLAELGAKASGQRDNRELERIDRAILSHPAKEIAAMVFDSEGIDYRGDDPYERTKAVYTAVARAARVNLEGLDTFQ